MPDFEPSPRSPEFVRLSTAAAITLGLSPGRMYRVDCTHCLNLLLTYPEGCRANCAYCGLAREAAGEAGARAFIRVEWPLARFSDLVARVKAGGDSGRFQRMCLAMVTHPRATQDTRALLAAWRAELPHIPVSILSNPSTLRREDLIELARGGAEIFTVALDAATPALFAATRGKSVAGPHTWEHYWRVIGWAAEVFGAARFGVHLIAGLGESERELVETVQRVRDLGGQSHLFAFFPEQGSALQTRPAVAPGPWRRVQLARFLIDFAGVRADAMRFDAAGRITDFALTQTELDALIATGKPFRTSGCPGPDDAEISACNRPYGDSPPSAIRSYPFPLQNSDMTRVIGELRQQD